MVAVPSSLNVAGTAEQRERVQNWLREICSRINVDAKTGDVTLGPAPSPTPKTDKGCDCLKSLIDSKSKTVIHLLPGNHDRVPQEHGKPAGDKDPKISDCGGGATVPWDKGAYIDKDGQSGGGSNVDVYIDESDNGRKGYNYQGPAPGLNTIECPLWLILAHELTTGHASWCIQGQEYTEGSNKWSKEVAKAKSENRAKRSESEHRTAHKLHPRPKSEVPDE
jgi:hypothetical protein